MRRPDRRRTRRMPASAPSAMCAPWRTRRRPPVPRLRRPRTPRRPVRVRHVRTVRCDRARVPVCAAARSGRAIGRRRGRSHERAPARRLRDRNHGARPDRRGNRRRDPDDVRVGVRHAPPGPRGPSPGRPHLRPRRSVLRVSGAAGDLQDRRGSGRHCAGTGRDRRRGRQSQPGRGVPGVAVPHAGDRPSRRGALAHPRSADRDGPRLRGRDHGTRAAGARPRVLHDDGPVARAWPGGLAALASRGSGGQCRAMELPVPRRGRTLRRRTHPTGRRRHRRTERRPRLRVLGGAWPLRPSARPRTGPGARTVRPRRATRDNCV